jgi:hypothetical protein
VHYIPGMTALDIKLLIRHLRKYEKEILYSGNVDGPIQLQELKSCIDDFRATLYAVMVDAAGASDDPVRFAETIRMQRAVEMLRKARAAAQAKPADRSLSFSQLVEIADRSFADSISKAN